MRRAVLALVAVLLLAAPAPAHAGVKKGIWGPVEVNGVSQFPIYKQLGASIYNAPLSWAAVARTRPAVPRNPSDPAYRWPAELDQAVTESGRRRIEVAIRVGDAPGWANGGRPPNWAPQNAADYA